MTKKEKQKRKEAMQRIDQEANCAGHNFRMGQQSYFFDVWGINSLAPFGPHRQYSKYMSSRWNGK